MPPSHPSVFEILLIMYGPAIAITLLIYGVALVVIGTAAIIRHRKKASR